MRSRLILAAVLSALFLALAAPAYAHGLLVAQTQDGRTPPTPGPSLPVTLATHRVAITIDGPVANVTVEQTFRSAVDRQLEGTYLFPLPEGAAVSDFAMTMGGKMVQGEVMDASKARAIYEGIVRRRRDPGLLEYVGRGLFRARVFPIPAKGDVTIRLSFQLLLPENDGTQELRYPLATDRLHGAAVGETVVTVDVRGGEPVRAVYSPSHDLAVVRKSETEVHASYESTGRRQTRDLVLYVGRGTDRVGLSLLSHKAVAEDGTFLAVLAPSLDRAGMPPVPKDVIFVLDTSGSMAEDGKIAQAKRALEYGIRILRPEDRFAIVSFASEIRPFRPDLLAASPSHVEAASTWLAGLPATGGTNIQGALRTALGLATSDRLPIVVFLTDGLPTVGERNTRLLVKMVGESNTANARVFTFGVGFDLDVRLLDQIAETTRGARDYVLPRDEIEIATGRFFRKVVEPALTDVTLDLGGEAHSVYPSTLPDLFAGGQLVVMGRYAQPGRRTLRLTGKMGDKEIEVVFEATFGEAERADYLPRLWAHRKVAFLLDEIRLHGEDAELVQEVKRLAIKHAIVTPYTSHLVVEEGELGPDHPVFASRPTRGRASGGHGGQYRGPGGSVPPGQRDPSDPTPAAPPPRTGPPATPPPTTTPAPTTPAPTTPRTPGAGGQYGPAAPAVPTPATPSAPQRSKTLAAEKKRSAQTDEDHVRLVAGRTFRKAQDGRWIDTAWDEKAETTKIEAFSDAWTALAAKGGKLAKILALGERILFVWEGMVYEIVPAPEPAPAGEEPDDG